MSSFVSIYSRYRFHFFQYCVYFVYSHSNDLIPLSIFLGYLLTTRKNGATNMVISTGQLEAKILYNSTGHLLGFAGVP